VECQPDLRAGHIVIRTIVTLRNTGTAPACSLRTWQKTELRIAPLSNEDFPVKLEQGSSGVLGAGQACQILAIFELTPAEFSEVESHLSTLFLFGVAEYQSPGGEGPSRTSWCLQYVPESEEYAYSVCHNTVS